jgi:hypothetical protein
MSGRQWASYSNDFADNTLGDYAVFGAPTLNTTDGPGIVTVATGGTSVFFKNAQCTIKSPRTQRWLIGMVFKTGAVPVGATHAAMVALADGSLNNMVGVGTFGAVSTSKFVGRVATGGVVVTAVSTAADMTTNYTAVMMRSDTTNTMMKVGATGAWQQVAVTANLPNVALYERHGGDVANDATFIDMVYWAVERQTT